MCQERGALVHRRARTAKPLGLDISRGPRKLLRVPSSSTKKAESISVVTSSRVTARELPGRQPATSSWSSYRSGCRHARCASGSWTCITVQPIYRVSYSITMRSVSLHGHRAGRGSPDPPGLHSSALVSVRRCRRVYSSSNRICLTSCSTCARIMVALLEGATLNRTNHVLQKADK